MHDSYQRHPAEAYYRRVLAINLYMPDNRPFELATVPREVIS